METFETLEENKISSLETLAAEYPVLAKYLESSEKFYSHNEIPLPEALYDDRREAETWMGGRNPESDLRSGWRNR